MTNSIIHILFINQWIHQ